MLETPRRDAAGAAAEPESRGKVTRSSQFEVATGAGLLQRAGRAICGVEAASTEAEAEGLALAGQRACRALSAQAASAPPHAAWVLHKAGPPSGFGGFSFSAANGQEAADHALLAHLLCDLGNDAVECVVDEQFAERPWQYQPISSTQLKAAFALQTPADAERMARVRATEAHLSGVLQRDCAPTILEHGDGANVVLVAHGAAREQAQALVEQLRKHGTPTALLGVRRLRPFPEAEVQEALQGKRKVVVLGADAALGEDVLRVLQRTTDGTPIDLQHAPCELEAVQRALGARVQPAAIDEAPCVTVGLAPAGPRARELLFAALSEIAESVATVSIPTSADVVALGVAKRWVSNPRATLDLVFIAHPALLNESLRLSKGARVVLVQEADSANDVARSLSAVQRELCGQMSLTVDWLDPRAGKELDPTASWLTMQEALDDALFPLLHQRLGLPSRSPKSRLVSVRTDAPPPPNKSELDFRTPRARPLLPKAEGQVSDSWRLALRRFHLTGKGEVGAEALLPLAPALATCLVRQTAQAYPLFVDEATPGEVQRVSEWLRDKLAAMARSGQALPIITEHQARLLAATAAVVAEKGATELSSVIGLACERFSHELGLSEKGKQTLAEEVGVLGKAVTERGRVLGLNHDLPVELYAAVVLPERRRRRAVLKQEVGRLHLRLAEMLQVDDSNSPRAAEPARVARSLGEVDFVDSAALAPFLARRQGSQRMSDERRLRLQRTAAILEDFMSKLDVAPELFLVSARAVDPGPWRVHAVTHDDPLGVALGLFDGLVWELMPVVRALRVARLEIQGVYDDAIHGPVLDELDWSRFEEAELSCLPPVLAVETAEAVWSVSQHSLSDVMQSGRPIHVLVEEPFGSDSEHPLGGLGYALVGHREAVVVQTSLARPDHLVRGLTFMADTTRPAFMVVPPHPSTGPMPAWLRLAAGHEGRAAPCFSYVPDRGLTWAESFDVSGNPSPEASWPVHAIDAEDASGNPESVEEAFTFAHAAALELGFRQHFWAVPVKAWSDEQIPMAEYLEQMLHGEPEKIPYVWTTDAAGNLGRAIVSRAMAQESHRALRLWRALEELGGTRNEYARRAALAARESAQQEAEQERQDLEKRHAAELERVRDETAGEALERLARALMDPQSLALAGPTGAALPMPMSPAPAPSSPAAEAAPAEAAPAPAVEEEEEEMSFSDPFVDTVLCTSCNECININPKLFVYNGDKQAVLGDASAGTFLQLVKAAEKCPASCIHPGAPRKGDTTANDELVARAAKFNQ